MKLFVIALLVSGCALYFLGFRGAPLFESTFFVSLIGSVAAWLAGK